MAVSFKSLDPKVRNATDIEKKGKLALFFQYRYKKRTTPMEFLTWDYQSQEIDVNRVDRLYYINKENVFINDWEKHFLMVGRMRPSIYFALTATHHEKLTEDYAIEGVDYGSYFHVRGSIYFTRDPHQFINVILNGGCCTFLNKHLICESLENDDGICIKDGNSNIFNNYNKQSTKLENLCYETIYQNYRTDDISSSLLPKRIENNVYNYCNMRYRDLFECTEDVRLGRP